VSITPPHPCKKKHGSTQMPPTWYSVVINNPTAEDEACINRAKRSGYIIEGQLEKGKNGTPHYQLAVGTTDSWRDVKDAFPRANVQEARDPVALRQYCVKTETRLVDFSLPQPTKCNPPKLDNVAFYDVLFQNIYEACGSNLQHLKDSVGTDEQLKIYDKAVSSVMASASDASWALGFATRAIRPDVRAVYRRYRAAAVKLWTPAENIDVPMHIQDADDDTSEQQDAGGSVGEEHEQSEAEEEGSGEEFDDDTEGSSEATDYEE